MTAGCGGRPPIWRSQPVDTRLLPPPSAPQPEPTAEQPQTLEKLTRADCLRIALVNNRPFRNTQSALTNARYGQTIASAQVYAPNLTASYRIANQEEDTGASRVAVTAPVLGFDVEPYFTVGYDRNNDLITGADKYETAYGVNVTRRLFAINETRRQKLPITTADKNFYVAANNVVLEGRRLTLEATRSFFNIQRSEEGRRVRQRRVEDAREFLVTVKDNVAHGFKAPVEELQASISLNQAEADLLDEETNLKDAKEHLLVVLAKPLTTDVSIVPEELSPENVETPDIDRDVARVLAHHEDLGNRIAEIDLEVEQMRIQGDQLWPHLTAGFNAEKRKTGDRAFDDSTSTEDIVALTFTYDLPLDLHRGDRAEYHQHQISVAQKQLSLREAEAELEQRLRSLHRRIEQLRTNVHLAELRLKAEEGKMAVTLNRYQTGAIDNLEVTRAKQDLDNAQIGLLNSRINLATSVVEYQMTLPAQIAEQKAP